MSTEVVLHDAVLFGTFPRPCAANCGPCGSVLKNTARAPTIATSNLLRTFNEKSLRTPNEKQKRQKSEITVISDFCLFCSYPRRALALSSAEHRTENEPWFSSPPEGALTARFSFVEGRCSRLWHRPIPREAHELARTDRA